MHQFSLWQLVLASVWLFSIGRKQSKMAESMLAASSDDADENRLLAASTAKTSSFYGFRGNRAGDTAATVNAIEVVAAYAERHRGSIVELDVNPLFVLPDGQGVVAVDALIKID